MGNYAFFPSLLAANPAPFDFAAIFGNFIDKWYYYLAFLVAVILIVVFLATAKPQKRNNLSDTAKITYTAILTAVAVAANYFTYYPVSYISISFIATVGFAAGYLLGAKIGFAVGFIGDLLGAIIFPAGAYNPLIGLASGLTGFIPGVIFDYFKGNGIVKTVISAVLCLVICTSGLNTFALYLMYGLGKKTFFAYLIVRLPWQVIVSVGNLALCIGLTVLFPKILPKDKFFFGDKKQTSSAEEEPSVSDEGANGVADER